MSPRCYTIKLDERGLRIGDLLPMLVLSGFCGRGGGLSRVGVLLPFFVDSVDVWFQWDEMN